jgi:hypothetical protein
MEHHINEYLNWKHKGDNVSILPKSLGPKFHTLRDSELTFLNASKYLKERRTHRIIKHAVVILGFRDVIIQFH